jgi:hypothetical protein
MENELKKSIACYIMGSISEITLIGDPFEIAILKEAIESSKKLLLALNECDIEKVSESLEKKRIAVSRYEKVMGKTWGL